MIGITQVLVPSVTSQRADLPALCVLHIIKGGPSKRSKPKSFLSSTVFTCWLSTCFAVSKVGWDENDSFNSVVQGCFFVLFAQRTFFPFDRAHADDGCWLAAPLHASLLSRRQGRDVSRHPVRGSDTPHRAQQLYSQAGGCGERRRSSVFIGFHIPSPALDFPPRGRCTKE